MIRTKFSGYSADGLRTPAKGGGGGLLGAVIGAGLAYMTGGASLGVSSLLTAASAGSTIGGMLMPDKIKAGTQSAIPAQPAVAAAAPIPAIPESQAAKSPTAGAFQTALSGTGQGGGAPGVAQTFLTGAGGVDTDKLALGKNSLLGA